MLRCKCEIGGFICFGPVASFAASSILASIGTLVLQNIRSKKELWFAAFPVLFAIQQFLEGVLWIGLKSGNSEAPLQWLTLGYLTFAYSLWPVLCPASVYAIEYDPKRKKVLQVLIALGMTTSLYLLYFILKNPSHASVFNGSIHYDTFVAHASLFTAIYAIVTILPYFISSHKAILIFGIPNFIFCVTAFILYRASFISVWCFFAAILSLTLYFFLRKLHHQSIFPGIKFGGIFEC